MVYGAPVPRKRPDRPELGADLPGYLKPATLAATYATPAAVSATVASQAVPLPARDYVIGSNGTRRVIMPLGDCNTTGSALARDFYQRTVIRFPRRITRFRIRSRNRNLLTNTILTSPVTLTDFYVGAPAYDTTGLRRWSGAYTATPTKIIAGPFTVPTDGSDVVTPWATLPDTLQESDVLLSYGVITAATGTGVAISGNGDGLRGGASSSGLAGSTLASGASFDSGKIFTDLRIEYEVEGGVRVGLFVGDSITAGAGGSGNLPPEADARIALLPAERWPDLAGRVGNFCAINLGVGSIGTAAFDTSAAPTINRAVVGTSATIPDFAVSALGTNNLYEGFTTCSSRIVTTVNALRSLGIKEVYLATILPKGASTSVGTLGASVAAAATSVVSSVDVAVGGSAIIGKGDDYEVLTVTAKTGTGPYTLTVSALTKPHTAGDRIAVGDEATRIRVNQWIRQMPAGISGVIDFDLLMADGVDSPTPLRSLMFGDLVHPHRGGAARMGLFAAQLGRI
jgi:hypothetical protein